MVTAVEMIVENTAGSARFGAVLQPEILITPV
jgi:hypothetical protein